MEELTNRIDEFLKDYDALEYPDHEDYINYLYDAVELLCEAKETLLKQGS